MKRAGKRYLALFLVLAVCLSIFPAELFAAREGNNVVINQVYGGGGNSGATYKSDFIELYNPTNADIVLDGWSVQYTSATGTNWQTSSTACTLLSGTIKARGYYLIQEAKGTGGTTDLPAPDATGSIAMGATGFKVALSRSTVAITGKDDSNVVDFVGAGAANAFEGSAPTPAPSNTLAIIRAIDGIDTDDNSRDFITSAPNPRNSASGEPIDETRVAAPKASIPEGAVVSGTRVALTSTTSGAAIYYTVDESIPVTTGSGISVRYSAPIAIDADVTITAVAVDESGVLEDSEIVTFTYTIKEASNVDDPIPDNSFPAGSKNINEVTGIADSPATTVTVVGQLAYRFGNYDSTDSAILQDVINGEIVALQVYNSLNGFAIGDVVKVTGTKGSYGSVPQLTGVTAGVLVTAAKDTVSIPPQEYESINALKAEKNSLVSEVVLLKDVTLGTYNSNGSTNITDKNNVTFPIYRAATYPIGVTAGDKVDLLAVLSKYNTTDQLRAGAPGSNGDRAVYSVTNDTKPPVITLPSTLANARTGAAYTISADVQDNKGVGSVTVSYTLGADTHADMVMSKNPTTGKYEFTIPAEQITAVISSFTFIIKATDVSGLNAESPVTAVTVENLPRIINVVPAAGSATGNEKRPEISVTFENADDISATLTLIDKTGAEILKDAAMTVSGSKAGYKPAADLADGKYTAAVNITRTSDNAKTEKTWSFNVGESALKAYFGQLHSHTAEYSDGAGTLQNGLDYIKNIPKNDNVQFVAFTDHSNYFDTTSAANPEAALGDISKATPESRARWETYTGTMRSFNEQNNGVLAIPGFEMTWSGGPGHINTFNTEGIVSRNNATLNKKDGNAGMKSYYELLKNNSASISQFNHPGTTFGTFADFAYLDQGIDERINMIEVGNGEGAVGSGGYFPSYEYYIQALDKGWHVAPTNNQDNHKGNWGNSNNARSVVITDDFSEAGLLQGINNMSMYSTEDKNLNIMYTVNDQLMGSIINEVPESLHIQASINDPDDSSIGTVEVVVNGGRVIEQRKFNSSSGELDINIAPEYSYYFLRVIQPDKDIAVTAPVWVGEVSKIGITGVTTDTIMPVKGEKMTFETRLYNYENSPLKIEKMEYSITHLNNTQVIDTVTGIADIPAKTDASSYMFDYIPDLLGIVTLTVRVQATLGGTAYNFEIKKEFEVLDPSSIVPIAIDGGHSNFYVTGNYNDSDKAFIEMCNRSGIRVVRLGKGELTYDNLKDKKLLVLTVPFASFGTPVTEFLYTNAEIEAIKQYAGNGGNIIVCSKSDRGDPTGAGEQAAVISNEILEAIGAKARVEQGIVVDPDRASNESYRITLGGETAEDQKVFNYQAMSADVLASAFLKDVKEATNNTFSAYNSAPIAANGATPLVQGFPGTTWGTRFEDLLGSAQKYAPKPGAARITPEGQTYLMTAETLPGGGFAIVAGVTFFSTFEVKIDLDNVTQKQNSNYQLVQNIIDSIKPSPAVTDIDAVHRAPEGQRFVIEGIVTSNASGYDRDTAFFDCIYVQDSTGGINVFPVSGDIRAGQTVRITGYTSSYLGERQLQAGITEIVDSAVKTLPEPRKIAAKEANEGAYLGSLVRIEGTVAGISTSNNAVESIMVHDDSGTDARIFIDGYITSSKTINNLSVGAKISAVGLSSHDTLGYRIRIRNRDDIICTAQNNGGNDGGNNGNNNGNNSGNSTNNNNSSNSSSNNSNNNSNLPVFDTSDKSSVKFTPEVTVNNGAANVSLNDKDTQALINTAIQNKKPEIVISPRYKGEAGELSVTLPVHSLSVLAGQDKIALTVNSDAIASVRITNAAIKEISKLEGTNMTVSLQRMQDRSVNIDIAVDNKSLSRLSGKITASIPVSRPADGLVAVLVNKDGSESILPKSVLTGQGMTLLLEGSVTIRLKDNSKIFTDVPSGSDAAGDIAFVTSRNLFTGTGPNLFSPDKKMTRSMLAAVLYNLESKPASAGILGFDDVKADAWYREPLAWAVEKGITAGAGNNMYEPDREITRSELACMLYKYAMAVGIDTGNPADTKSFADGRTVPAWAADAVGWTLGAKLFNADDNNQINPNAKVSRAEVAGILRHLVELSVK